MGLVLLTFFQFMIEHHDLVDAVWVAVQGGATKVQILAAIRQTQIDATNTAVLEDLGPRAKP